MTAEASQDVEVILPGAAVVDVEGVKVRVRRLRTREFFALLQVITTGMGPALGQVRFNAEDSDELQGQLLGVLLAAAPNAVDEFIQFVSVVIEPVRGADRKRLSAALDNPDIGVLVDVLTVIVEQEKDELSVLAGKVRAAVAKIQTAYRPVG